MSHDLISEATFLRASTAKYVDSALIVKQAAIDAARDAHFIDLGTKTLLLEGQRTNGWSRSEELNDGAWTKNNSSITTDAIQAPDGATTADKVVENTANQKHGISRNTPALTDNKNSSISFFAKAGERTRLEFETQNKAGTFKSSTFNLSTGATSGVNHVAARIRAVANGFYLCEIVFASASGGTTPNVTIWLINDAGTTFYVGDGSSGLYLWGLQFETDKPFASSYIPTVASAVTRSADKISWPFTLIPQGVTAYVRFVERGNNGPATIITIANAAEANPRFLIFYQNPDYRAWHGNGPTTVKTNISAASIRDMVELRAVLFPDGAVQLHKSINGGSESSSTKSAALNLASAWSDQLIWVNSVGSSNVGFSAFQSVKVAPGVQSRAFMRDY
ncbi:hypothetical protein MYX75_01070 [Acidobacteria bacterium AH-259-A15]|nr:hypothetical protein [Acidobacteria bacterium AH-259-A15]